MKRKTLLLLAALLVSLHGVRADEGMWIPSLIGSRIDDMRSKGFKLTAEDIYSVNHASMKDAIVRFGRGCTGELVSAEGLLFTNHHCGFSQIQQHSSVENDYLTNGFWAMSKAEELPNPGLTVTFLVRMEDVTQQVLAGTEGLNDAEKQRMVAANSAKIAMAATEGTHYEASVAPFYYGNQYFLFVNEIFRDVRLVGAPPSSIGKFGGDTDNWMWPRHTGDFSIFRIYADKDNKPADYSPDNVPYKSKRYFSISTQGVGEGDFTMIYGFPGTTKQYLHSAEVDFVQNYSNPAKIGLRTIRLDIINAASEADRAVRIAYAAKAAGIANSWKKWQGEVLGLERLGTIGKKRTYEEGYKQWAQDKPPYSTVVDDLQKLYDRLHEYAYVRDYYNEALLTIELIKAARDFNSSKKTDGKMPEELIAFYKDYYPEIDREITKKLLCEYMSNVPEAYIPERLEYASTHGGLDSYVDWLFDNSIFVNGQKVAELYTDPTKFDEVKQSDPALLLYTEFLNIYRSKVSSQYTALNSEITALYNIYVRGMMLYQPEKDFFPDANSTLRVAYGHIEGYKPQDAMAALPVSTIDGIIEKDNPDIYDYDIPQSLRDIYASKDYGRWAAGGTVPVCMLATNHTTGGNSGSPLINADGRLVGINFDRTWLSTMSDIEFDPVMCRNIAVDMRYVLFVIEKIGGAQYLFNEMELD